MTLEQTIDALIGREGGYSNHPADTGRETMWGITVATARAFGYMGPMAVMPREVAVRIYTGRYWTQPGFSDINMIDSVIAEELLDTGVNMGTGTAARFLQRALNVLGAEVTVDGTAGVMTRHALKTFLHKRGDAGRTVLLRMLNAQQSVRYMEIAEADPSQKTFVFGWHANRVGALT